MPALRSLVVGDAVEAWEQLGFTVIDSTVELGRVTIVLVGDDGERGIIGWSLAGVDETVDGLPSIPLVDSTSKSNFDDHNNGVFRVEGITLHSDDLDRSAAAFEAVGLQQRDPGVFWAGRSIIELEDAPTDGSMAAGKATFGRLALGTDDFDRTAELLGTGLGEPRPASQEGRVVGTVDAAQVGISVSIDIVSPHPSAGIEQLAADARAGH